MIFRYSGNKWKILAKLNIQLPPHKRLVEGYLGSGAFLLSRTGPSLGIDVNPNVIDIWKWLQTTTPQRLHELEKIRQDAVANDPNNKPDVRDIKNISKEEMLYMRVNVTGVYVGQLSSWKIYPKWKLPVEKTVKYLDRVKEIDLILGSVHTEYKEADGDLIFLDPPYAGTKGNYKQDGKKGVEESYCPQDTVNLISKLSCPVILTYGTDAKEVFPQYKWIEVLRKKVPLIRKGGTLERIEHVSFINFP